MRILFYNHTGLFSGAERVLLDICANLDRDSFEPIIACPSGDLAQRVAALGIPSMPIEELNMRFTWRPDRMISYCYELVRRALAFRRVVAQSEPDIVHANSVRAGVIATLATIGMPTRIIWHVHDILKRHPFTTAIRLLAFTRGVRDVIAVSNATATAFEGSLLKLAGGRTRVRVIYNGIEVDRFRPDDVDRVRKRVELGLAENEAALGIIGQISPRKGQLELIRAFAKVRLSVPNARLYIAGVPLFHGNSAYFEVIQNEVVRLGLSDHVCFLGRCEDTPSLLRALDIVIVNSRQEPLSLVTLEAQASATAVLATAVGGIPEMVTDGENGFLLKNLQTDHLADRLAQLITNPSVLVQIGERGRAGVLSKFSTDIMVRTFQNLYAEGSTRSFDSIGPKSHSEPVTEEKRS
jgi:L-malate glycosyltransferase